MTLIRVIIAACLIWMAALPTAAAEGFLSGIEDLPLMPGLTEDADGAVNFETATGRIVEIKASGAVQSADITAFYAEVLPQLGWIAEENGAAEMYIRDRERLRVAVETLKSGALVSFSIHPLAR